MSPHYDPMLAKVIASGADRDAALTPRRRARGHPHRRRRDDLGLLRAVVADGPTCGPSTHSTSTLDGAGDPEPRIDVLEPGR